MRRPAGVVLLLVAMVACGGGGDRVVVGSKNFTEQRILGELLAQTIEAAGIPVQRKLDLGGTFVCDAALRAGQIDVYVEYTGTALTAVLKRPPDTDPARVLAAVREAYDADGLVWMEPLGFDNTFALVVRPDAASGPSPKPSVPGARGPPPSATSSSSAPTATRRSSAPTGSPSASFAPWTWGCSTAP